MDGRVEAEGLLLAKGWRQLRTAVNLSQLQHETALRKAEALTAAAQEACDRALEEARDAKRRRVAAEERERELEALNATLKR